MPSSDRHATLVWTRPRGKQAKSQEPYVAARVVSRDKDGSLQVTTDHGAASIRVVEHDAVLRNPPGTRPDNCQLLHLNEACVLENICGRFAEEQIYTWTSHVLTSVNPYQQLPLYSEKLYTLLPSMNTRDLPPHAFSIAEMAVRGVTKGSQAVVVSGESGAGKTVNMAHVMAYLTQRAQLAGGRDHALGRGLGALLLRSNPILEAFGNAQTVRNHNSSRFGKFIKVMFDASGTRMTGMHLQTYLLEKVRVVSSGTAERTYHVFYALVNGAQEKQLQAWGLRTQRDHLLTTKKDDGAANEHASADTYNHMLHSLSEMHVSDDDQNQLLGIVAAIIHLREVRADPLSEVHSLSARNPVRFQALDSAGQVGCRPIGSAALAHAAQLLGCPGIALRLVQRVVISGGQEAVTVALTPSQAAAARDALCKSIYVAAFKYICCRFNDAATALGHSLNSGNNSGNEPPTAPNGVKRPPGRSPYGRVKHRQEDSSRNTRPAPESPLFIALLDMFGFETFDVNSFEQLCINLANERLQGYFQQCVFKAEEDVHRLEGVLWPKNLEYHDNHGCISLVEKSILPLLDEACGLQNPLEENYFLRVNEACGRDPFFTAPRRNRLLEEEGFVVRHFAGDVCYCSAAAANAFEHAGKDARPAAAGDTWLVKNADRLLPELARELKMSSNPFIASLFVRAEKSSRGTTVARRFKADLDALLADLGQTKTLFIRCIKPNERAAPLQLDRRSVLAQLRCLGMTDVVQLMHKAFPTRIPYEVLHGRYATGLPPVLASLAPRDFCEAIALMCDVAPADMAFGTTRLFLRGGKGQFLEDLGHMDVATAMPLLLKKIKDMECRRAAGKVVACAVRTWYLRVVFRRKRVASDVISRTWHGFKARKRCRVLRAKRDEEQAAAARAAAQKAAAEKKKREESARSSLFSSVTAAASAAFAAVPGLGSPSNSFRDVSARRAEMRTDVTNDINLTTVPMPMTSELPSRAAVPIEELPPAAAPSVADETLYASLGVNPLCSAQLRALQALRQRLGEHFAENTSEVEGNQEIVIRAPSAETGEDSMTVPARRRLAPPTSAPASAPAAAAPSWLSAAEDSGVAKHESVVEVSLERDARDGTLGIDLDQFAGVPTVAIIVPGGPAERDGLIKVGDIVIAVDGIQCDSIGEVIGVLTSPACCAKNPLKMTLRRKPTFAVAQDELHVRCVALSGASDGIGGISGEGADGRPANGSLSRLMRWTRCHCALHSDRRMTISEPSMGLSHSLDLRAALSVQLVLVTFEPTAGGGSPPEVSCLQVRTHQGIIEFCAPTLQNSGRSVLHSWQRPLEDMLMLSLGTAYKGWLRDVSASVSPGSDYPLVFLDLNSRSQLRTLTMTARTDGHSHMGVIELAELQEIAIVDHAGMQALQLSGGEQTCVLVGQDNDNMDEWLRQLQASHRLALIALVQYTGMILIDGWLDYQGDDDEWASGFFVLTIGNGLQCFENAISDPASAEAMETIPLSQIKGAVRSKGMDYYDWCIDIRTTDNDYIRVRPPRQAEMSRWLATVSLYCTPPPKAKRKAQGPRRKKLDETSPESTPTREDHRAFAEQEAPVVELPTTRPAPPATPRPQLSAPSFRQQQQQQMKIASDHPGLVQGWSHNRDTTQAPSDRPMKRRSLSFSRRRSSTQTQMEEPQIGPSRGGRLKTSKSQQQPSANGGTGRSLGTRRLSFGRRRNSTRSSNTETQPDTEPKSRASMFEDSQALAPQDENSASQKPLRLRTMSWGRRRGKSKAQESLPAQIPPVQRAATVGGMKLAPPPQALPPNAATPSGVSDGSSETSEPAAPAAAPEPQLTREHSFGRKIVRRAASFSLRRHHKPTQHVM